MMWDVEEACFILQGSEDDVDMFDDSVLSAGPETTKATVLMLTHDTFTSASQTPDDDENQFPDDTLVDFEMPS